MSTTAIQAVRGMNDVLPDEACAWQRFEDTARDVFERYGYRHLRVPIVPVAIRGAFEIWPRTKGIDWRLIWPWSGHRVRIAIGSPITVTEGEGHAAAAARLRENLLENLRSRTWRAGTFATLASPLRRRCAASVRSAGWRTT